jgi:hypothetical protein
MNLPRKFWVVLIRIVAAAWFLLAAISVFGALLPFLNIGVLKYIVPNFNAFVEGFGMVVSMLWAVAMAFFYGLIGYAIWRLDDNYRMSIVFLCVLLLFFSIFRMNIVYGILLLSTIFLLLSKPGQREFFPRGRGGSPFIIRSRYDSRSRRPW